MIQVDSVQWVHDAWEIRSRIEEGVYHLKAYPVRITHLAHRGAGPAKRLQDHRAWIAGATHEARECSTSCHGDGIGSGPREFARRLR